MIKKVGIVTGTRAEYSLFKPVLEKLRDCGNIELQIFVTGMHLSPEFGLTYREIMSDGWGMTDQIEMLLSSDTDSGVTKSLGLGIIGFSDAFRRNRSDLLLVLGDRFETFAAVQAAYFAKIPIAHLHGGEATEGLIDDGIRHAITKMSHIHFTSTEQYRQRIIRMGELPQNTFNVGALGVDNAKNTPLMSEDEFRGYIANNVMPSLAVVTYHPVTLEVGQAELQIRTLLAALEHFKDTMIIFTKPNADMEGRIISTCIEQFVETHSHRARIFTSMGTRGYLSALKYADVVIGNSSSGIIEAPSFGIPTVNIGDRQKGRIKPETVIDCEPELTAIVGAIQIALSGTFKEIARCAQSPYGDGTASYQIVKLLEQLLQSEISIKKPFFDGSIF